MNGPTSPTTALASILALALSAGGADVSAAESRPAVVVELFTSQGCSSCPPADRLLTELGAEGSNDVEVIPLSFHVDYWNYIGWTDPFSAAEWSQRQRLYAARFDSDRVYTPQAVIDGRTDCVGSDRRRVADQIAAAAATPAAARLTLDRAADGRTVRVATDLDSAASPADVLLAIFETGLTTAVGSGENASRTLHNDYVVRRLVDLGSVDPGESVRLESTLDLDPTWSRDQLGVAVLVQAIDSLEIYGARALRLSADDGSR